MTVSENVIENLNANVSCAEQNLVPRITKLEKRVDEIEKKSNSVLQVICFLLTVLPILRSQLLHQLKLKINFALKQEVRKKQKELGKRISRIEDIVAKQDDELKRILAFTNYNTDEDNRDTNIKNLTPRDVSCQDKG